MQQLLLFYTVPNLTVTINNKISNIFTIELVNDQFEFFKETDTYNDIKDYIIKYWSICNSDAFTINMIGNIPLEEGLKIYDSKWDNDVLLKDDLTKISYYLDIDFNVNVNHIKEHIVEHIDNIINNWI